MPFIGTTPAQGFASIFNKQTFTANGSTTSFTLNHRVNNANDLEVFVGNVRQEPTEAYSAAGLNLTMTEAPANGVSFYVIYKGLAQITTSPSDGSVGAAQLQNNAITNAKIANSTIDLTTKTTGVLPDANGGSQLVKLLDTTVSSTSQNYDIDNTYINSTYDAYKIIYNVKPTVDNDEFHSQLFMTTNASGDAGSIISGNNYAYQNASMSGNSYRSNNASSYSVFAHVDVGNATGEGINIVGTLMNVNDTTMLTSFSGTGSVVANNGAHQGFSFHHGMATPATYGAYYCRGIRFKFGSGEHSGRVKLFGIK